MDNATIEIKKIITGNHRDEKIVLSKDGRFYKETTENGIATYEEMDSASVLQYKIVQDKMDGIDN